MSLLHSSSQNIFTQHAIAAQQTQGMDRNDMIKTYVSYLNDCFFGKTGHATSNDFNATDFVLLSQALREHKAGTVAAKLKAIINIATKYAESLGANEQEIQKTIQVATVYCMYNRYVQAA